MGTKKMTHQLLLDILLVEVKIPARQILHTALQYFQKLKKSRLHDCFQNETRTFISSSYIYGTSNMKIIQKATFNFDLEDAIVKNLHFQILQFY